MRTSNRIFRINIGNGLFLVCELTWNRTLNFLEGITWNRLLFSAISISYVPCLNYIIRDGIARSIDILRCDTSSSNRIFCINVSDCLSIRGKLSSWIALYCFKGVSRNRFLFSCIAVSYITCFNYIIGNCITRYIYVLNSNVTLLIWDIICQCTCKRNSISSSIIINFTRKFSNIIRFWISCWICISNNYFRDCNITTC